jgi:hypothetical protein
MDPLRRPESEQRSSTSNMYRTMDRGFKPSLRYAKVGFLPSLPPYLGNKLTARSNTAESLSGTSQRRSSLYQNAQAGNAYLSAPGAGP